ncbi:MAG TPA: response regulator [Candidatus Binatia bacterium]|nr:response regulator [Candidatus Binatia bacterium]
MKPNARARGRSWLADLPIQAKLGLAFVAVLGLFALSTLGYFLTQRDLSQARTALVRTGAGVTAIEQMFGEALNQDSALRGYLLTGDEEYLEPYDTGWAAYQQAQSDARRLVEGDAAQSARLDRALQIMQQWREEVAEPAISFRRKLGSAIEAVNLEAVEAGRKKSDELRALLREMRQTQEEHMLEESARLEYTVRRSQLTTGVVFVAGVITVLLALGFASRQITRPMAHLTLLMQRLSRGDTAIEVPELQRKDELGAISRGLEAFRQAKASADTESWIKAQLADLNGAMQSTDNERAFAQVLLRRMCPLIGVTRAAFFVHDEARERLGWVAGYGDVDRTASHASFRLGEGLVGECAAQRAPMQVSPVPPDYVRIASGLGEAAPRDLQLQPVVGVSGLLGVIELAALERLTDPQQRLLEQAVEMAGLVLEAILRTQRTKELLAQSQAQAEELQATGEALRAQQEELHSTNESLQEKNKLLEVQQQKLRDSEAEMRAQSEELRVANEELAEKSRVVNESNRQLQEAQRLLEQKAQDLERASRYKSEFLANMSHELRTPLNSLLILGKSFADNEDGNLTPDQIESAKIIYDSGNNLLRLINDILDLSKVEAGKVQLVEEAVFLRDFATVLERNFRPVARDRGLEFRVEYGEGLPDAIVSDSAKLQQVLTNLLGNSFKFTERGGVTLLVRRPRAGEAVPPVLDPAAAVVFAVRDSGIGVAPEKLDKIFGAFEQVDASTSRKYGGTGLGLSISRGLVQLLGGDIRVESSPGEGSTFLVYLGETPAARPESVVAAPPEWPPAAVRPAAPAPAPASAASTPAPERPAMASRSILVIEDDAAFAKILADTVQRRGFRALVAADGEAGLALASQERPLGILLDLKLPGIDGWEVMRRLKDDAALRTIPVHIVSAEPDEVRGRELGAVGFMTKPLSRENIDKALDRVLHFTAGHVRRVLLVEDDAVARADVKRLLASEDVAVVETRSGAEGLEHLAAGGFDCVILDLQLPDMNGVEFLDRAARNGPLPPVVVNTAGELSTDQNLKLRAYTDSIVVKGARSRERLLDEVTLFLHSIRKPAGPAAPAANGSDKDLADKDLSGKTVLIVDDDMRNIFALSKTLRNRGMHVLMAQDGSKALSQLDSSGDRVDIVLMDIMMPGMDGYETTRAIRKNDRFARLPVIGVTAKAMRGDREKCLEAGANDYLAKPIDVDKLLSVMRVWVNRA